MADEQHDAPTRIRLLLEFLHEREMDLEDMAEMKRAKLEQCVQLRLLEQEAKQVCVCVCSYRTWLPGSVVSLTPEIKNV